MAKAAAKPKLTDEEQVAAFMTILDHPLKNEIEALRTIIKSVDPGIRERIKWNAPSYSVVKDMVTFMLRRKDEVLLVFHHPEIVNIQSPLLKGDFKDRRLMLFRGMQEVDDAKTELQRIVDELFKVAG